MPDTSRRHPRPAQDPAPIRAMCILEVCRALAISSATYYRLRRTGVIPAPDIVLGTVQRHSWDQIQSLRRRPAA